MALEPEHNFHIEDKILEFEVEVVDAQFNAVGRYFLKLSVQSLATRDYSQIQLRKGPADSQYIFDSEVISDVVTIEDATKNCIFQDRSFTFKLPKGFLKNDKNHDVFLLVEAFTLPDNDEDMGTKVGEGKVAIYPRTNAPRINFRVERGQNMYHFTDIMTIRRTVSSDELKMHCGRLKCVFSLREEIPPQPQPTTPPVKSPDLTEFLEPGNEQQTEEDEPEELAPSPQPPLPVRSVDNPPASPGSPWEGTPVKKPQRRVRTPSPTFSAGRGDQMLESPVPQDKWNSHNFHPYSCHVARHGKERVDVLIHGATSIPSPRDGSVPQPFATVKSTSDETYHRPAQGCTHASLDPTHTPIWEELISVEVEDKNTAEESLVLTVGDKEHKESLVTYRLPLPYLKPYHQYHLELVMPSKNSPYGIRTFATITRKTALLPRDMSCPNYCGLEVVLCAVEYPLLNPVGPLIAVARVVPDGSVYRNDNLMVHPRAAGVTLTTVTFPSPHPSSFNVPNSQSQGYPQITLHGYPEAQPVWNHRFLFSEHREKATLFTPSAALILEYYPVNEVVSDMMWRVQNPVGFSVLPLDENVYKQLTSERGRLGLVVKHLPVQGSNLIIKDNQPPTVGLVLRLITSERPETLASVSDRASLPLLLGPHELEIPPEQTADYYRNHSPEVLFVNQASEEPAPEQPTTSRHVTPPPRLSPAQLLYKQRVLKKPLLPIKDGELPPFDAMESVLPEYQYIFVDPNQTGQHRHPPREQPDRNQPVQPSDHIPSSLLDHHLKELENYRTAVHKMGQDILTLREQIREQEAENSRLRRELTHYDDNTRFILDSTDLDGMSKPELAARYASLKQKLASQTAELKSYKDRVQKLQNDIIKKNDREKELQKVRDAHTSQQDLLLKFQEKVRKVNSLEEACRKQERVIEKMEKLLDRQRGKKDRGNLKADTQDALLEENRRLRQELERAKDPYYQRESRPNSDESEKLELYQALDKAEGRIMSLEKQLAENSRQWGRERADLLLRMTETDHGFGRPGGSPLLRYSFPAPKEPRRYSKAPPPNKYSSKLGSYY